MYTIDCSCNNNVIQLPTTVPSPTMFCIIQNAQCFFRKNKPAYDRMSLESFVDVVMNTDLFLKRRLFLASSVNTICLHKLCCSVVSDSLTDGRTVISYRRGGHIFVLLSARSERNWVHPGGCRGFLCKGRSGRNLKLTTHVVHILPKLRILSARLSF